MEETVSDASSEQTVDDGLKVRIYDEEGRFIGIYEYSEIHGDYKPVKLFMEA